MSTDSSRRAFLRQSLYVAGAAGLGIHAGVGPAYAQAMAANADAAADLQIVNIGANTLSIGPSRPALEAIARTAPLSGDYGRGQSREFLETLSAQLEVPADHIAVYPGSGTPLGLAVTTFTSPQRSLVTADPTYEQAWRTAPRVGAKVVRTPQRRDYSHDVEAMCAADPKAGLLYICNPNNPTGAITSRADIEYAANHRPPGSVLVVDEAYIHFSDNAVSALDLAVEADDVIVLRTFSKLYGMAGLRLGYAVASPANLERMNAHGGGSVAMTTLAAGTASLLDPGLVPARRAATTRMRNETVAWLQAQGYPCSTSEANCFLVDIGRPGREFQDAMATHGVMVGRSWPGHETRPRISVGTEAEMQRFREAFTAVAAGQRGPLPVPQRPRMALREAAADPARMPFAC
ncbi:pyridoxal phosphate-dependent aminotransferase [Stenotrophomonas sp. MMGLT7]|uniref:pyridoxal phosphate-dependent aminotransferase n=1 Tax=Stenotrophomonas sp. MMGLT7 TaxID=2901227 RepID=UPI001E4E9E96|nr:pyridoxal phosphate-dependent aminotransferase [Stenotrophomonas sp. MMGLT7]MCD7097881.1 pyridoxal phosphate-dependent aminotransferase [Stenotrophomonas sp. MMGLT7]